MFLVGIILVGSLHGLSELSQLMKKRLAASYKMGPRADRSKWSDVEPPIHWGIFFIWWTSLFGSLLWIFFKYHQTHPKFPHIYTIPFRSRVKKNPNPLDLKQTIDQLCVLFLWLTWGMEEASLWLLKAFSQKSGSEIWGSTKLEPLDKKGPILWHQKIKKLSGWAVGVSFITVQRNA